MASEKIFFQKNIQIKIIFEQFVYLYSTVVVAIGVIVPLIRLQYLCFLLHSMNNLSFKNELA